MLHPGISVVYDVHTGKLRWDLSYNSTAGRIWFDKWDNPEVYKHLGGANAWQGLVLMKKGVSSLLRLVGIIRFLWWHAPGR